MTSVIFHWTLVEFDDRLLRTPSDPQTRLPKNMTTVTTTAIATITKSEYVSPTPYTLWYTEYKTTDKYMIRLSNRFRYRYTNTFI